MPSSIHSILPRAAIALALPALVVGVGLYIRNSRPYVVPANRDIFDVVTGRWAWTDDSVRCRLNWHDISFSKDHRVMTIAHSKSFKRPNGRLDSLTVYDIQAHTASWIRGAIRGEQRLTADGRPVVWDLVLRSPNRYMWHRTDWLLGQYTSAIERCRA